MLTYITAFIFYTLAMIGVMLLGFVIYKKTFAASKNENKGMIKVIDSVSIAPKKMLLMVKVRDEKFLIASDAEHTTFLSRLDDDNAETKIVNKPEEKNLPGKYSEIRFDDVEGIKQGRNNNLRNLFINSTQANNEKVEQTATRKQMIKQLIKELNENSLK